VYCFEEKANTRELRILKQGNKTPAEIKQKNHDPFPPKFRKPNPRKNPSILNVPIVPTHAEVRYPKQGRRGILNAPLLLVELLIRGVEDVVLLIR